jgi:hypothetical protein
MADEMQSLARKLIGPLWPWIADRIPIRTGTYTPTYEGSTTPGVTTYTTQQGAWTRLGNLVVATGTVVWSAATGTGTAQISLPFTSANVSNQFFSGSVRVDSVTFANGTPQVVLSPNTAFFFLVTPITNAGSPAIVVEAAGNIVFTIAYFI